MDDASDFRPASLLKVPIMIAAFKAAEADPGFLSNRVVADLDRDMNDIEEVRPASPVRLGSTYTVDELVRTMITQSDNNATALLNGLIHPDILRRTLEDLGVGPHGHRSQPGYVSVIGYATFLRVLYNASYLGREMSEKALSYLAESSFQRGLVAGVPKGVAVAHKFGEAGLEAGTRQLHDCGIVYYPGRPYILCVMTRGPTFEPLYGAVAEISRAVYEEVDRQVRDR